MKLNWQRLCVLALALILREATGEDAATTGLSDEERAREFVHQTVFAKPFVFSGNKLPDFDFEKPDKIRELIGPYTLKAAYYDADYKQVTEATKPGRYGAVVEIIPADTKRMPVTRQFVTLYRLAENYRWWQRDLKVSIELPKELGVDPQAGASQSKAVAQYLRWRFFDGFEHDPESAILLAGLRETTAGSGEVLFCDQPWAKDRQWWVGLRRKFYGYDKLYPKPFVCPIPIKGKPAPVIHEGSAEEAGMKPDATHKIDLLLMQWSNDTDEAFNVCIIRHGVVVLNKAYGTRDGKPMTTATKSWLASSTKTISGAMFMMLVDQGLLDLDMPITKFPGPLRDVKTNKPVTFRHLYTLTAGFEGHWGDDMNDMEERMVALLPQTRVGEFWTYAGSQLELAWKYGANITGESFSQYAFNHLIEPLGCVNTEMENAGGATRTTAADVAKICQMLLNRGAYGKQQFFSEQTFEKMLPQRLTKTLGPDTDEEYGIGTKRFVGEGLSDMTFAHGSGSYCTVRIDPLNDLVIVMVRNDAGKNFRKYHPQFLQAIVDGMVDRLPSFQETLALPGFEVAAGQNRLALDRTIENHGKADMVVDYEYDSAGTSWKFEPTKGRLSVPPGGKSPIHIEATLNPDQPAPLPKVRGSIAYAGAPGTPIEFGLRPVIRRLAVATRLSKSPAIDGALDENEYGNAKPIKGFLECKGRANPPYQTEFRVAYDEKALYLTIVAFEKNPQAIKRIPRQRDGDVWKDDCVEIFIDTAHDRKHYRQFMVNLDATQLDSIGGPEYGPYGDLKWNAKWNSMVILWEDRYVTTFAIPYEALGISAPKKGETWGLNICRSRTVPGPLSPERASQWVMTYDSFHMPSHFGDLKFD